MNTYTFSTINDKDFEALVLDLLNEEYNLDLQDFKVGRDGGIDLRHSSPKNNNEIVVQAKHYLKTDFKKLIRNLTIEELSKVKSIRPDRYIFATSLELSAKQKDEIKQIFKPFIVSSNDVLGNHDINRLLRKHKGIEKQHFKLWFSSTEIISNILNNAIEGRTKSYLAKIKVRIPFYVLTKIFDQANKTLVKEKILLITGQPGVGKTTLAEALLYEKAKNKYKVYIINTIREAEDVISMDNKEKQIFYFDDFLGEVYYEIIAGSQKESEIARFVDRIKHTPNKFIILSTRTVILEQAKSKSEKIKRSRIETGKYEVVLESYTNLEKAQVLYNHLFFQNLGPKYFEAIIDGEFYMWIIKHNNYTPRIIEFITDKERIKQFSIFEYKEFITRNLNHPEEIWQDSFQNQIDYFDRCFLQTMFTFQRGTNEINLRKAFEKRLKFEKRRNNKQISTEQFNSSIKNLMSGFVVSTVVQVDNNIKHFNFINPSISDFLISYFKNNYSTKKAVVDSAFFLEQLEIFNPEKGNFKFEIELQEIVKSRISKDSYESLDTYKEYNFIGYKIEMLIRYCNEIHIDDVLLSLLKQINLNHIWWIRKNFEFVLENIEDCPRSIQYIELNFITLIEKYMERLDDPDIAIKIPKYFKKFGYNFSKYQEDVLKQEKIIDLITRVSNDKEKDLMNTYKDQVETWDDYDAFVYDEVNKIDDKLTRKLLPRNVYVDIPKHYVQSELKDQIEKNKKEKKDSKERVDNTRDIYTVILNKANAENRKIADLFYVKGIIL